MLNDLAIGRMFVLKKKPLIITCVLLAAAIALSAAVFGFGLGKKREKSSQRLIPTLLQPIKR